MILVTGSTGFLGAYLVPALLEAGYAVRAMARSREKAALLREAGAEVVEGDLLDPDSLRAAVRGCDAVVHLAAVADSSDPDLNERVNVGGTRALGDACVAEGVPRVINLSSTCAGRPLRDAYGETKLRAEQELAHPHLTVTHLRPTMIYGHGSQEFDLFARVVERAPRVPIPGDGRSMLQPVFVLDAVALILRCLETDASAGKTYDVSGPEPIEINEFIGLLGRIQGRTVQPLHVPARLALLGARVLGRLTERPFINVDQVMAFLQDTEVDIQPARRDLAFDPRPLEEGLSELFGGTR